MYPQMSYEMNRVLVEDRQRDLRRHAEEDRLARAAGLPLPRVTLLRQAGTALRATAQGRKARPAACEGA